MERAEGRPWEHSAFRTILVHLLPPQSVSRYLSVSSQSTQRHIFIHLIYLSVAVVLDLTDTPSLAKLSLKKVRGTTSEFGLGAGEAGRG